MPDLTKEQAAFLLMALGGILGWFLRQAIEALKSQITAIWNHINAQAAERAQYREKIASHYYTKAETDRLLDKLESRIK